MIGNANNIQWLRLIFAVQVLVSHVGVHLGMPVPYINSHFPGVPAFFFVSGFLIYDSFLRDPDGYARNRFLRLFPGLLAVTLGSLGIILAVRGLSDLGLNLPTYAAWFLGQITVIQAYNPAIFHSVGIGEMNGSLWTITVEILFYLCVPVIVLLERRWKHTVVALTVLSFAVYAARPALEAVSLGGTRSLYGLLSMTPIAWGWMFGFGILARQHLDRLRPWLRYALWAAVPFALLIAFAPDGNPIIGARGNELGLVYFILFAALILWAAFETPFVKLRPDFSYGLYIWHMPVINAVVALAVPQAVPVAISATVVMAVLSWYLVERPGLNLKKKVPESAVVATAY